MSLSSAVNPDRLTRSFVSDRTKKDIYGKDVCGKEAGKRDGSRDRQRDMQRPEACPALVLNADFRPLSYFPLSLWSWQDALKAVFLDRVDVVAHYETSVRSPSFQMQLPSVVSLRSYVSHARTPAFTRFNVFLRDSFTCQYCGATDRDQLTFDHVIPRSRGGKTTWNNIITACSPCNLRKGGRMPEKAGMVPHRKPVRPTMFELNERGRAFPPHYLHESWQDFLYWDAELEP